MSDLELDVVIIGSGVAGLSAAIRLGRSGLRVGILTKATLGATTTAWAQGGVAAVVDEQGDSLGLHVADTLRAGAGLCDESAVDVLVTEGPAAIEGLVELGARFDRDVSGALALAREGGHSAARVLHAGGVATGAEVQTTLEAAAVDVAMLVAERCQALELLLDDNGVAGVRLLGTHGVGTVACRHVVLATGGAGQLFNVTTNPPQATGDGIAMALRAEVPVADVEFVQFHPTALHVDLAPRPLLSEALRGHGAILRDVSGERFVDELAPRDVVARAIVDVASQQGTEHVWLDVSGLADFGARFPSLTSALETVGLNPATDWLPVSPAAHHLAGGVLTDLYGATACPGLWAIGETADVGVHGANRLASNSLLEGLVFGGRMAEALVGGMRGPTMTGALGGLLEPAPGGISATPLKRETQLRIGDDRLTDDAVTALRVQLATAMTVGAGVVRDAERLTTALTAIRGLSLPNPETSLGSAELCNLATVAEALLIAALAREESRGGHYRIDFPSTEPRFARRLALCEVTK